MVLFPSAAPTSGREASDTPWWFYTLLGVVLLIAGAFVLGDVVFASVISAIFIAWAIVIGGIFQIIHAFSARGWKGFVFDGILGALYVAGGGCFAVQSGCGIADIDLCARRNLDCLGTVPRHPCRRPLARGGLDATVFRPPGDSSRCDYPNALACFGIVGLGPLPWH